MLKRLFRNAVLCGVAALMSGAPVQGQNPAAEPQNDGDFEFKRDENARMTVPVSIDGRGPYRFVVDTGAERTVISGELARRLKLAGGKPATMHSMTEVGEVETVVIPRLTVNSKTLNDINAPALSQGDLGADGMLGVDSLVAQRVLFDFKRKTMTVSAARKNLERRDPGTIVVRARSKFGRLILADARADGQKIWVVVDTGSQVSIGNEALRKKLAGKKRLGAMVPVDLISVTGGTLKADYTKIRRLQMGGIELKDMPIAFADAHPFKKLGLTDQPAMLLGMDGLEVFDQVSVDFLNRRVSFNLPSRSSLQTGTRLAALAPAGRAVGK